MFALFDRIIPWKQVLNPVLFIAVAESRERASQIGKRINGIELACFDERSDGRPVLGSGVVPGKECVLPIEGDGPDGSLDAVVVDLDAAVGKEVLRAIPVFGDVGQSLLKQGLGRDTGTVIGKPGLHISYQRSAALNVPVVQQGELSDQVPAIRPRSDTALRSA